ncbi:Lrp/AsnC family transcriptional regulator [Sphingomonas sp.]|jgi:Lrp/AsnC family leucine-responsive transcriptional regulator|uniref:Lrp/AsnC family transcriptional regulator n=1 Tax=Sphingomonas sp. TaxID=28214 RepID=UPI0035C87AE8
MENSLDRADAALLAQLQRDSSRSIADIAGDVGLSPSSCQRRIKALEASGMIEGYHARLDPVRIGFDLHALIEISLTSQNRDVLERFEEAVGRYDEILECDLMAGHADYVLRVAARDLQHFDAIHRNCLSQLPEVAAMRTYFAIRPIKRWSGYPVR